MQYEELKHKDIEYKDVQYKNLPYGTRLELFTNAVIELIGDIGTKEAVFNKYDYKWGMDLYESKMLILKIRLLFASDEKFNGLYSDYSILRTVSLEESYTMDYKDELKSIMPDEFYLSKLIMKNFERLEVSDLC